MLTAIQLNDQVPFAASEVRNKRSHGQLAHELMATELPVAKDIPKPVFGICLVSSQSSGAGKRTLPIVPHKAPSPAASRRPLPQGARELCGAISPRRSLSPGGAVGLREAKSGRGGLEPAHVTKQVAHTPVAGMPVRCTARGAVISFQVERARLTAPRGSRATNWPCPGRVLISLSTMATSPRVSV